MQKDYYAILGITSAASQEEIRMAYDKLPVERKMEAEEAYLILSNPQARFQYDRIYNTISLVKNFDGFDRSKVSQGSLIGTAADLSKLELDVDLEDPEGVLPDDFAEIFQAAIKNIINATSQLKALPEQEDNFKNGGDIFLDLAVSRREAAKGGYFPLEYQRYILCSQCQDKNTAMIRGCLKCGGLGKVMAHRRVEIKVPKNSLEGSVLRVTSEGHVPSGDLLVKIIIRDL